MKYEKCTDEQKAQLQRMDIEGQQLLGKLRVDMMTSPELKAGIQHVAKLAKLYVATAGYKRIGEALAKLGNEIS